jgi:hypothetical protein
MGVKKNPQSPMYTQLGVLTKGTIIEVNVSELGMVTTGGKVVFGKYAQVTNNPENDGCINAVLCKSDRSRRADLELNFLLSSGIISRFPCSLYYGVFAFVSSPAFMVVVIM